LQCMIWAIKHGCPWNRVECQKIAQYRNHRNIVKWINNN
jgi:hypothetical protein